MDLKATIAASYRNRLILIALAAYLYSAWCVYDALVAYPKKMDIRAEFERVQEENPDTWKTVEWPALAEENGWDGTKVPDDIDEWNIRTQWIQFALVFPIGSYCFYSLVIWSRRYIGADEAKLYDNTGAEVPFEKITRIDAGRWDNKGIAVVYYDTGAGEGSVVIDDWKYVREPSDEIFDRLKANVDAEKIEGLAETPDEDVSAGETAEASEQTPADGEPAAVAGAEDAESSKSTPA